MLLRNPRRSPDRSMRDRARERTGSRIVRHDCRGTRPGGLGDEEQDGFMTMSGRPRHFDSRRVGPAPFGQRIPQLRLWDPSSPRGVRANDS